jgi:hypothetical protein
MAQELKRIIEANFVRGYNDDDKPEYLRDTDNGVYYMADIVNAFCDDNKIVKRGGYTLIGNAPVATKILGQERHEPYGGSKYILRARNNAGNTNSEIEGWSGTGNWVTLTGATTQTANAIHTFVMANNATYIFNSAGDVVLKTTNGTSASTVATIPQGTDAAWFHNYFFVYGVSTNPSRLYFSDVNTPETFNGTTGYIDVNPGDNEPITALGVLKDELLIFKPSRVWSLTGFGTADFTLDDLGERVTSTGTVAAKGVLTFGNDAMYISYRGDVPHFRSAKRTEDGQIVDGGVLSDAIGGTMERINVNYLSKIVMEYDGKRVWCAVPLDTAIDNNAVLVYDTSNGGWVRFEGINAADIHVSTLSGSYDLYFGSSTANGKSYKLNSGKNDDGVAISMSVKTPYYNPQPGYQSRYKYLYLTADSTTGSMLDINYSFDGFTFNDLATVDLTGLGAKYGYGVFGISKFGNTAIVKHRLDWAGGTGYFMQYEFANAELNQDVILREWEIFYQNRGLRSTN